MVYSSAQISGLVGGQMAMFSNQQQYAQQISGLYGTGPQQMAGGMQNPFPSAPSFGTAGMSDSGAGSAVAQGMAGSVGGILGGASLAGGFMGGAAGWADPFTGMARGFGFGSGGMFGNVGSAISGGYRAAALPGASGFGNLGRGLAGAARGGWGALGGLGARGAAMGMAGGLGAAAATGGLYYAAAAPIMEAADQFASGAQNVADVGMLANEHMGPQYGKAGSRPGGGMGRTQIRQMVGVLEELAGDETMATMDVLKRLMDQAGQAGMLQGIGDAQQFKQKFGGMVSKLKQMAVVMGTSLEEAAPLFGQMERMGLWSTADVMGTAGAMGAVGAAAAPQMMATMQGGARLSHAMGGTLGAGAIQGRESFLNVQAAQRSGALSREQIMEFTGGVGGVEGQRMVAQQMQGVVGRFSETPMGRLMMAGLGKFEGGSFTGGVDKEMMQRFMSGDVSVGELQKVGQQRTSSSREAATSYMVRKGTIGQEMMAQGGMEGLSQAVTQVMDRAGYGEAGENIQNMFIQKMTGVDARTAEMLRNFSQKLPQIREEKQRSLEAHLEERFRDADRRMNRSWEGFKDSWGQAYDESWRPVREFGSDVATELGRSLDAATDYVWGRTKSYSLTARQKQEALWSEGGLGRGGALTQTARGAAGMAGGTGISERMRNMSRTNRGFFGAGGMIGSALNLEAGTRGDMLSRMGADTMEMSGTGGLRSGWGMIDEGGAAGDVAAGTLAGGVLGALGVPGAGLAGSAVGAVEAMFGTKKAVNFAQAEELIRGAVTRSEDRSWGGLGFEGTQAEAQKDINKAKSGMRRLLAGDPDLAREFAEYKKDNPQGHMQTQWLMEKLKEKDPDAWEAMQNIAGKAKGTAEGGKMMDAMALVMDEAGMKGAWSPDWEKDANYFREVQMFRSTQEADEAIGKSIEDAARIAEDSILGNYSQGTKQAIEDVVQSGEASDIAKALGGDEEAALRLSATGRDSLGKLSELTEGDEDQRRRLIASLGTIQGGIRGKARLATMREVSRSVRGSKVGNVGAATDDIRRLAGIYGGEEYATGGTGAQGKAEELMSQLIGRQDLDIGALQKRGGLVGRQVAEFAESYRAIGGLKTGEGITLQDIEGTKGVGALHGDVRRDVKKMLEDDNFTEEERSQLQERFKQMASQAGVAGGRTGRGAQTDKMTELLTSYTEANTKFVFAVGAAMQDVDVKDLQEKAVNIQREVTAATNPSTRPGSK